MIKTSAPTISVIITNYNYGKYINQAIESVLRQTYENIELIIINDGSTDDSDVVIKRYTKENPDIIYVNQKNHGVVYTRNKGMERATGDYICCLDADDYFNHDYIEKQYKIITKYNADVVYPNWSLFGDINQKIDFQEFDFIAYQKQHFHIKPESLIRASKIKYGDGKLKHGYIPETKERANDWAYFISLAAHGLKFKVATGNYVNYRIKQGSMGSRFTKYEDIKIFYKYLTMLKKQYGEKIIEPIELPIDIIKQQEENLEKINAIIRDKDLQIENISRELRDKNSNLERRLEDLQNSISWRITKPLRRVNKLLKNR